MYLSDRQKLHRIYSGLVTFRRRSWRLGRVLQDILHGTGGLRAVSPALCVLIQSQIVPERAYSWNKSFCVWLKKANRPVLQALESERNTCNSILIIHWEQLRPRQKKLLTSLKRSESKAWVKNDKGRWLLMDLYHEIQWLKTMILKIRKLLEMAWAEIRWSLSENKAFTGSEV